MANNIEGKMQSKLRRMIFNAVDNRIAERASNSVAATIPNGYRLTGAFSIQGSEGNGGRALAKNAFVVGRGNNNGIVS